MNATVNISFQKELLLEIDKLANEETRSRSELIREAARAYLDKKKKWKKLFQLADSHSTKINLKEHDIQTEIKNYRKSKTKKTKK